MKALLIDYTGQWTSIQDIPDGLADQREIRLPGPWVGPAPGSIMVRTFRLQGALGLNRMPVYEEQNPRPLFEPPPMPMQPCAIERVSVVEGRYTGDVIGDVPMVGDRSLHDLLPPEAVKDTPGGSRQWDLNGAPGRFEIRVRFWPK